jgi:hypothetical protein
MRLSEFTVKNHAHAPTERTQPLRGGSNGLRNQCIKHHSTSLKLSIGSSGQHCLLPSNEKTETPPRAKPQERYSARPCCAANGTELQ